jgi:two-component system chemotaxis response regulator CheB
MNRDVIVIGASAGGLTALKRILPIFPPVFPAGILIVLHTPPQSLGMLDRILSGVGDLEVSYAKDGEPFQRGRIYIAPADHHLLIEEDRLLVVHGPKENRNRPAIDPLFRSVAAAYGPRVIGLILSGCLNDGTSGLHAVKRCGGMAIVQDPGDAEFPDMPSSALKHVDVDHSVALEMIGPLLLRQVKTSVPETASPLDIPEDVRIEAGIPAYKNQRIAVVEQLGKRSALTCPDCNGALWEMNDGSLTRYRCHVGHAFTTESLAVAQNDAVEKALWIAVKSLEESAVIASRMGTRAKDRGDEFEQALLEHRGKEATSHAATLREVLMKQRSLTEPPAG